MNEIYVLQLKQSEGMEHPDAPRATLVLDASGKILKNRHGPQDAPWRVWEVNDMPEWVLARTREEAVLGYLRFYGNEVGQMIDVKAWCDDADSGLYELEEITALDAEAMERHKFCEEEWDGKPENYIHWQCECGAMADNTCRWNGLFWEHHHPYPVGHVPMKNIHVRSFREELERRIAEGPRCEQFASSER
jgi:hypothetical protein